MTKVTRWTLLTTHTIIQNKTVISIRLADSLVGFEETYCHVLSSHWERVIEYGAYGSLWLTPIMKLRLLYLQYHRNWILPIITGTRNQIPLLWASDENSALMYVTFPLHEICLCLVCFPIFLFIFLLSSWVMMFLGVVFLVFILLGFHQCPWVSALGFP